MGRFIGEFEGTFSTEARELGYPGRRDIKWSEAELWAMKPEIARLFLPEAARQLYLGTPTKIYDNPVPLERNPALNANQERASDSLRILIYQALRRPNDIFFASVVGPMAGGKSSVVYEALTDSSKDFLHSKDWRIVVCKQKRQIEFDGRRIVTHGFLEYPGVKSFDNIFDIPAQLKGEPCPDVIIAEEVQFAFAAKDRSEQKGEETIRQEIKGFLEVVRQMGVKAVIFTSLDRDFATREWPHMKAMLSLVDLNLVVTARCVDCNGIAYFTQRDICENGVWRPARIDEDVVVAGNVGESKNDNPQRYQPKCLFCHQVLPARNSKT